MEPWRYALAIAAPLVAATVWGLFAVPGDPSRSGRAPVPVPGIVRLLVEGAFFGVATFTLFVARPPWGAIFGGVVVAHYALSWDRVAWLVAAGRRRG